MFWTGSLHQLAHCGMRGTNLAVSNSHSGIEPAMPKLLSYTWHRCCTHFMRNALAYAGTRGKRVVVAFIAIMPPKDTPQAARERWRKVTDQLQATAPKPAPFLDTAKKVRWPTCPSPRCIAPSCRARIRSNCSIASSSTAPG